MNNYELLIQKYKNQITPKPYDYDRVMEYIKNNVDLIIDHTDYEKLAQMHNFTTCAFQCLKNQMYHIITDPKSISYSGLKLAKTKRNKHYFHEIISDGLFSNIEEADIYILIEPSIGYIDTNSNRLLVELVIEEGISQDDYDSNTCLFYDYLIKLDSLTENTMSEKT